MIKRSFIIAAALLAVLTTAENAVAHEEHAPAAIGVPSIKAAVPLAARYDLQVNNQRTDWYLWREADTIETANVLAGQNNIWQRTGPDAYNYRRVFHRDRRVVEYMPGELRTLHAEPDWEKLGSIISPQLLAQLKRGDSKRLFGQRAVRYSGRVSGQTVDLWWLEEARLPAALTMANNAQRMSMKLKELQAMASQPWPRADETRIAAYSLIDAADLGDMESDPFVARLLQQDGHNHSH